MVSALDHILGILLCIFLASLGAGFATMALVKGEMRGRGGLVRRKKEPIQFWFQVTLGYAVSLFCAILFCLAWRKGEDMSASSFDWISGRRPLIGVFIGLIGAVVYKLWGKENSN